MEEMCRLKEYMERASSGLFLHKKGDFFPLSSHSVLGGWGGYKGLCIAYCHLPYLWKLWYRHRHWSLSHQSKPTINPMVLSKPVAPPQLPPPHTTLVSLPCPRELCKAFGQGREEGKTERAQCCCVMKWQIEPARQCPGPEHDDIHFTQPLPVPAGMIGDANFDFCVWKRYCLMEVCGWRVKQAAKCQHKKQTFSFPPSPM